jgi:hypothetical protein
VDRSRGRSRVGSFGRSSGRPFDENPPNLDLAGRYGEFEDRGAFEEAIESVIHNYDDVGVPIQAVPVPGSVAYWSEQGLIVITNPGAVDGGTAFFGTYDDFLQLVGR